MKARSGWVIAAAIGTLGLGTLGTAGVAFREPIVEAYERWRSDCDLGLRREGGRVWLTLRNKSDRELRIFQFWNSWGYWTVSFRVRDRATGRVGVLARKRGVSFTRNFPAYFTIPARGQFEKEIDLRDKSWVLPDWLDLDKGSYLLQAQLTIEDSAEARQHGVFVGHLASGWK